MAFVRASLVLETTTTTGTGTLTLAGAKDSNWLTFAAQVGGGNTCAYAITASNGQRETGVGTVVGSTLERTTLLASSTGTKLDLPAGTHEVGGAANSASFPEGVVADANGSISVTNVLGDFTAAATSGQTITLTVASKRFQKLTGTEGATVTLPDVSTLVLGQTFVIDNDSTQAITVNSSGGNLVVSVVPDSWVEVQCGAITGTSATSWDLHYPIQRNGAGGTPSSLNLTNATGLPIAGGGTGSTTAAGARTALGAQAALPATSVWTATSGTGTWTWPTGCRRVDVFLVAGGASGAAGGRAASGTAQSGGGGGGGGGTLVVFGLTQESIGSSVSYTVGAGGSAVSGRGTDGTGAAGNAGGNTYFGNFAVTGGGAPGGGNTGAATAGASGGGWPANGGTGGAGAVGAVGGTGGSTAGPSTGAGGAGGGTSSAPSAYSGGTGGSVAIHMLRNSGTATTPIIGGGGGTAGGNGGAGDPGSDSTFPFAPGAGGGGGASSTTGNGGDGGAGGYPGAGGGGGGSTISGTSGAGGAGGGGYIMTIGY